MRTNTSKNKRINDINLYSEFEIGDIQEKIEDHVNHEEEDLFQSTSKFLNYIIILII